MTRHIAAIVAAAVVAALAGVAAAQDDPIAANAALLRDRAMAGSGAWDYLEGLTTEVGPRPAGSPAMIRAKDWTLAKLTALGFQNVHAEPFTARAWARGAEAAEVVAPFPQRLVLAALGGSDSTPKAGLEAQIILFKSYADMLDQPPGAFKGRIVVVTQRQTRAEDGSGYGAVIAMRTKGPSEAARRGAVAYLIRSLATDDRRSPHAGAMVYAPDAPRIPCAALSGPDADQLERIVSRGLPVRVRINLQSTQIPQTPSWNVVGEVRGRETADQVVLLAAHLDSWDLGTGAVDDGAGDAILVSAAKLIMGLPQPPRRTIRVVLFGGEEMDQAGPAYGKAHAAEAPDIAMASESDFGAERIYQFSLPAGAADTPAGAAIARALAPIGANLSREPATRGGTDVEPLVALGVPTISMRQDGTNYFDLHHTADDTLDKVDAKALDQNVAAWAAVVYVIADSGVALRPVAAAPAPAPPVAGEPVAAPAARPQPVPAVARPPAAPRAPRTRGCPRIAVASPCN